jgi:hypothetical protein
MKRRIYSLAFLAFCSAMTSNDVLAQRSCGSHEHLLQQLAEHPEMAVERQRLERFTESFAIDFQKQQQKTTAPIFTIPVVVHVLYNNTTTNISTAQIQSQIDQLNLDYQKLNADASLVPAAFSGVAADIQVQFCLAQRDPSGNATTGIIRKSTTKSSFSADNDDAKSNSTGGDAAWPATQYLNLWVVPAITSGGQGGILGYAQFPGGPAGTDGVVIGYNYFGTTGAVSAPFNKGRTGTHEVGHWMNLYHIWGDDGNGCTGSDLVGDTPNQGDENYGCPAFPTVSCSNGPNGDMFMNYMDYTDDACMYMFSTGQKSRMHAVFASGGSRNAITTSLGCTPPVAGACNPPSGLAAGSITTASANLSWGAASGATGYNLQWKAASSGTWTTVSNLTGTSYSLSGLAAGTSYNFQVQTKCAGTTVSSYSSASTFTTTSAGCTDNYESNNSISAASLISANTNVTAKIGTSTDKDYFKFSNSSAAPRIKVTLSNHPYDYDLKLYKPNGTTLVATSQNGGTTSESIIFNTTVVGTYYIYVYGYAGAYSSTSCYNLIAQTSASNFRELNEAPGLKGDNTLQLFPNPASNEVYFDYFTEDQQEASISIIDQAGRLVRTMDVNLEPGANQPKMDISNLSSGLYFVRFIAPEGTRTAKLMIAR